MSKNFTEVVNEHAFTYKGNKITYSKGSVADKIGGPKTMAMLWSQGISTWGFLKRKHPRTIVEWACRNCDPETRRLFNGDINSIYNHFGAKCEQEQLLRRLGN